MKKNLPIIFAALLFAASCKKSETKVSGCTDPNSLAYNPKATVDDGSCTYPVQKTYPLVILESAFWCPVCGSYAIPAFNDLIGQNLPISVMSIHQGDPAPYEPACDDSLTAHLGGFSMPSFFYNSNVTASNEDPYFTQEIIRDVNAITTLPAGAIDMQYTLSGSTVNITSAVKFFEAVNTPCNLSFFAVEDSINYSQQTENGTEQVYERYMVRACAGAWSGYNLGTSFTAKQTIKNTYSITLPAGVNNAHVKVVAVLWQPGVNQNTGGAGFTDRSVLNTLTK